MSAVDGWTGKGSKGRLVAIASTASTETSLTGRLLLVAFDFPDPISS